MSSPSGDLSSTRYSVVLAGGSGTRLWPLSTPDHPKHLLKLGSPRSLLQETLLRIKPITETGNVFVVAGKAHFQETARQLGEISPELREQILVEPMGRNTLPAIAWAVLRILEFRESRPDTLISVFPSDHQIRDDESFLESWKRALAAASLGYLVTFGIRPTSPETGFGYILAGKELRHPGAYQVDRFVEKPGLPKAREYVAAGNYYWNSGIFVFRASLFLEELKEHQPLIEAALRRLAATSDPATIDGIYESLPSLSIDHGLLEKSKRLAVVPASFEWNDLGSWDSVYRATAKDADGNVLQGQVIVQDTKSSLLISEQGLLAVIGLKNAAVVQTEGSVLVVPLDESQKVRDVVEKLREKLRAHPAMGSPPAQEVSRPWGTYLVLEEGPNYKIKRIFVKPGHKLSLQRHEHRAEHWVVVEGTAKVVNADAEILLRKNESTFIPMGQKHRLENPGPGSLVIIEVQTGSYVGEDDIERFEDIYGRPTRPRA